MESYSKGCIRCTAAKHPDAGETQGNRKRPILLHQERFSVLKIRKESYKNGNEGIRMSVKGELKHMGVEQERLRSQVSYSQRGGQKAREEALGMHWKCNGERRESALMSRGGEKRRRGDTEK